MTTHRASRFFPALVAATSIARASPLGLDLSGVWQTDSGYVTGRGGGPQEMIAEHVRNRVTLRYGNGHAMVCTLVGVHCRGRWHGGTGGGWFEVTFASDGQTFSGTWGYNTNHADVGTFTGHR